MHEIAYQKVEKLSFFLKVWWDVDHQIWWDALIKFDEIRLIKFDEMSLIRFDEIQLIRFDEMSSVRFDEKSSCSYQVWWVAFVKFDKSLSSSLMSRLVKFLSLRKIELDLVRHLEKTRVEQSKHKRWNDQAWSRERIHRNILCKRKKSEIAFFDHISHFETRRKNTLLASSQQVVFFERNILILVFCKRRRLSKEKQLIIVMFSKKKEIKIFKTIKRLFSFIIVCYSKNLNTIQSFREIKKRDRLTLKNFHHIFQDVIVARQKDFELDFDYNSFSFKLFLSIISDQFFRKSIFDSINDIDLFDLKIRSSSSLKSFNRSLDKHVSFKQLISFVNSSRTQSSRNYEKKHQNDLFIRNNAIKKFFRVSNMTDRNAKSADFHEFLTLRRNRRAFKLSNSDRRNLDRRKSQRFRRINIRESQKIQNRQSQDIDDYSKSIKCNDRDFLKNEINVIKAWQIFKKSFSSCESKILNDLFIKLWIIILIISQNVIDYARRFKKTLQDIRKMIIEMFINDNILILYFHFDFDAKYEQYRKHYAQTHDIVFVEFNLAMKINYAINKFLNICVNRFVFVELIVIMTIIINIFSLVVFEIKNVVIIQMKHCTHCERNYHVKSECRDKHSHLKQNHQNRKNQSNRDDRKNKRKRENDKDNDNDNNNDNDNRDYDDENVEKSHKLYIVMILETLSTMSVMFA